MHLIGDFYDVHTKKISKLTDALVLCDILYPHDFGFSFVTRDYNKAGEEDQDRYNIIKRYNCHHNIDKIKNAKGNESALETAIQNESKLALDEMINELNTDPELNHQSFKLTEYSEDDYFDLFMQLYNKREELINKRQLELQALNPAKSTEQEEVKQKQVLKMELETTYKKPSTKEKIDFQKKQMQQSTLDVIPEEQTPQMTPAPKLSPAQKAIHTTEAAQNVIESQNILPSQEDLQYQSILLQEEARTAKIATILSSTDAVVETDVNADYNMYFPLSILYDTINEQYVDNCTPYGSIHISATGQCLESKPYDENTRLSSKNLILTEEDWQKWMAKTQRNRARAEYLLSLVPFQEFVVECNSQQHSAQYTANTKRNTQAINELFDCLGRNILSFKNLGNTGYITRIIRNPDHTFTTDIIAARLDKNAMPIDETNIPQANAAAQGYPWNDNYPQSNDSNDWILYNQNANTKQGKDFYANSSKITLDPDYRQQPSDDIYVNYNSGTKLKIRSIKSSPLSFEYHIELLQSKKDQDKFRQYLLKRQLPISSDIEETFFSGLPRAFYVDSTDKSVSCKSGIYDTWKPLISDWHKSENANLCNIFRAFMDFYKIPQVLQNIDTHIIPTLQTHTQDKCPYPLVKFFKRPMKATGKIATHCAANLLWTFKEGPYPPVQSFLPDTNPNKSVPSHAATVQVTPKVKAFQNSSFESLITTDLDKAIAKANKMGTKTETKSVTHNSSKLTNSMIPPSYMNDTLQFSSHSITQLPLVSHSTHSSRPINTNKTIVVSDREPQNTLQ